MQTTQKLNQLQDELNKALEGENKALLEALGVVERTLVWIYPNFNAALQAAEETLRAAREKLLAAEETLRAAKETVQAAKEKLEMLLSTTNSNEVFINEIATFASFRILQVQEPPSR